MEQKRIKVESKLSSFVKKMHKYAYLETFFIVSIYLLFGYILNSHDICILNGQFSYILIILSIITLFHGFENGMLGVGIIAFAMWYFYPSFNYVVFLSTLMMILILSEFHYYWTKRIREAEANAQYRNVKLNELSRAFYSLKISHDQLEKNYVTKPMSIRNSILSIKEMNGDQKEKFNSFLKLLEISFNVSVGSIAYKNETDSKKNTFIIIAKTDDALSDIQLNDQLIEKALEMKKPVFISNDNIKQSKYIAVIPTLQQDNVIGILLIEKMPFMSFNRETLTSIAIISEYFFNEIKKENVLMQDNRLQAISDEEYKYEYFRLFNLYKLHKIDSTSLVIKVNSELLAIKLYETIDKLLRSLDMVTLIEHKYLFYISILFPLADKAVSIGFLDRLLKHLHDITEDQFEYMTFGYEKIYLYDEYISIDHE